MKRPSKESVRRATRQSQAMNEEVERAIAESDDARQRAQQARYKALLASVDAGRADWEARTMAFLAAGNARHPNGTFIATFLRVQDELREAELHGVPLSDAARSAIVKMGRAEKAIKAASAAAKAAAERAAAEYAATTKGNRARQREQGGGDETAARSEQLTAAERARRLAEEASTLAAEAAAKERHTRDLEAQLREAQAHELLVRDHARRGSTLVMYSTKS